MSLNRTERVKAATYAHGRSDGFEAGLDAAIAEIVRYADECNTEDAGRYARAGLNGARFRIEALKSKPSQAAEGEKREG